jgi:uncharacterized membrane-anchored protein YitT (DUF2179 family)
LPSLFSRALKNDKARAYLEIVVGCVLGAAAYPMFLVPNNIAPGGLTGIATILNYLLGSPVGVTSMLLNLPLFVLGYRAMGKVFVFRSLVATLLFSALIDLLPLPALTDDILLGSVYGGILLGIGLGIIFRGGATTGGSDMVARMVHNRFPFITVGIFLFMIDCCVVLAAGFTMSARAALYALICIFVSSKVLDLVLSGFGTAKACFVISDFSTPIARRIMEQMERGATLLKSTGAYSGKERSVILCVVTGREVMELKKIVREEDPRAFLFITDTHETLGEGFANLSQDE